MKPNDSAPAQDMAQPTFVPGAGAFVKPRTRIPTQSIILLLVLGVSAGSLYAMRQIGIKSGVTFAEIPTDVNPPDNEKARTYERIMADLARIEKPLDVALVELGKSPFMWKAAPQRTSDGGPMDAEAWRREQRMSELRTMMGRHKIHSVMGGTVPLARIDDATYTVGDMIDEVFTITEIAFPCVKFTAEGEPFELCMDDTAVNTKGKTMKKAPVKVGGDGSNKR
jgi:hypothetical protein